MMGLEWALFGRLPSLRIPRLLAKDNGLFSAVLLLYQVATWWIVGLEATVALTFLWPGKGWVARQRHLALAVFCATIYAIAPIVGFGWLLLVMGAAQCEPERTAVRTVYLVLFFVLLVYQALPWTALLAD